MSPSQSAMNTGPQTMASVSGFEISDLPPPDTVHGLWQENPPLPFPPISMVHHFQQPSFQLCNLMEVHMNYLESRTWFWNHFDKSMKSIVRRLNFAFSGKNTIEGN